MTLLEVRLQADGYIQGTSEAYNWFVEYPLKTFLDNHQLSFTAFAASVAQSAWKYLDLLSRMARSC